MQPADAGKQLKGFIAKFEPKHQALIRAARKTLRERFPTAIELVYDNYNFFVIGYGPTERPSDSIISIAAAANGVGLCFIRGASLPDPAKILQGSGKQTRFVRLPSADILTQPEIQTLLTLAADRTKTPMPAQGKGKLIIRSISAKQRPRRKPQRNKASAIEANH
jgi:Domain of unknown function (DU1801)